MIYELIEASTTSQDNRNSAISYLNFCDKLTTNTLTDADWDHASPYGGMIPAGAVAFFKIVLNDIQDHSFILSKQIADTYTNLQFSGGDYENAYTQLQELTSNEFAVDDFKIIIDGNGNPYLGFVDFSHQGVNWNYAPDTFEAPFGSLVFKYLNYFLSMSQMSDKRFAHICFTSGLSDGATDNEGIFFINHEQFALLEKYHFLGRSDRGNAFWERKEGVVFNSVAKE
ncbi:MAG: hypothetical protein J0M10_04485 [Chitinophagales bacterium]|nr:hypothetical protein [Chitinophagales bacterium]